MSLLPKPPAKVNYLNNRDILKEIHLSKNTYCWYRDRDLDHQFDLILPSVDKINQRTVVEARKNRADRIKRETGEVIELSHRWSFVPAEVKNERHSQVTVPDFKSVEELMA